jgi:hypothetical protein
MIEHDSNTIRKVAWAEVLPWLNILRVFRVAIAVRALVFGAVAILLTTSGWGLMGLIFGTDSEATQWLKPYTACSWIALTEQVPSQPQLLNSLDWTDSESRSVDDTARWHHNPVSGPWLLLTSPAGVGLAHTGLSLRDVACLLLCGLLSVAVWAFFGAAICRMAAVQLAADEQVGMGAALRFACRKWPSYCAAPLLPIGGVLLATIPVAILGIIMRANLGVLLAGLIWPLALVAGLLMSMLLLGLLFGWPLMWATISTEGTDSFDALSRSYAYTFQRPLHYLFYAAVAGLIGWLGWLLVQNFAAGVVWMSDWAAAWGSGVAYEHNGIGHAGVILIRFWAGCIKLLAVGYLFSYFWSAATAIYLLLRRDVDATEMDEVYLDADASEQCGTLPKVVTDQAGAPVAEDASPDSEPGEPK